MALIGRELAEAIDKLIVLRLYSVGQPNAGSGSPSPELLEDIELVKRDITDALLEMDSRKGVYVSGQPIHPCPKQS